MATTMMNCCNFPKLPRPFTLNQNSVVIPRETLRFKNGIMRRRATVDKLSEPTAASELRRSANYHPTIWDHNVIESISSPYIVGVFDRQIEELKLKVKSQLDDCEETVARLRLVDSMRRLGVAYHFEDEIERVLDRAHADGFMLLDGVYETGLCFRILREHQYNVSTDVFDRFRDHEKGGFKESLAQDVKGLLSLHEASYLGISGEQVLDEAKEFSVHHLIKSLRDQVVCGNLKDQVEESLQVPLRWRMPRNEAKNYIDAYKREDGRSLPLLELAMLDFNVVQSIHQEELKELSRWWENLGLRKRLEFSRDRLVENYLWAAGIAPEPQFSKCRKGLTKLICFLSLIDDTYDIYGSLEELNVFTSAIQTWESKTLEILPKEFKLCFLALTNFSEEIANDIRKDYGLNILPLQKKEWAKLCGAHLVEAQWFNNGYKPTLKEYLDNAWMSIGGPIAMFLAYYLLGSVSPEDSVDYLECTRELTYFSSLITRLSDDLGTSEAEMQRGDVPKSIQCRMIETTESEEESRKYIWGLLNNSWKEMNKESLRAHLSPNFVNTVLNMARTAQCIYQHGDGIGTSTGVTKNKIASLFIEPIPL